MDTVQVSRKLLQVQEGRCLSPLVLDLLEDVFSPRPFINCQLGCFRAGVGGRGSLLHHTCSTATVLFLLSSS